jgi:hypothetical protein
MATRSRIGALHEDGQVESIYCHFDGYITNNGDLLQNHWSSREKMTSLLRGGDIGSLGEEMGDTLFYIRDRGEADCESIVHPLNSWPSYGQEFEYLFNMRLGTWAVRKLDGGDEEIHAQPWVSLVEALKT